MIVEHFCARAEVDASFDREEPYRPAFRNFRELAGEETIQRCLHTARVAAPPGLNREVLLAVEQERRWRCEDAGVGREFPQQLAGCCVECVELAIRRAAREDEP